MAKQNTLETVIVPIDRYKEFEQAYYLLEALRGAGVDNWDGWEDVVGEFYKDEE